MPELEAVAKDFRTNVESVHKLMDFDRYVLDFAIAQVERLHKRLSNYGNPADNAEHALQALKTVRENDSLRPQYQTIFNQCVVLLVSYCGSAVGDIFRASVPLVISRGTPIRLLKEELKVTVQELAVFRTEPDTLADFIIDSKREIHFQDMQSIVRTFTDYFGVDVPRDSHMNDVILAQACRHVIVHTGEVADRKLVRQLVNASPRNVKETLREGERIQFNPTEVRTVSDSMIVFFDRLSESASTALN